MALARLRRGGPWLVQALFLAGIAALARLSGLSLLLFPELGALSSVVVADPGSPWARSPLLLVLTPTLAAVLGLLVSRHLVYGPVAVVIVVAATVLLLRILHSPVAPALSAGYLPLALAIRDWSYPLAILIATTALALLGSLGRGRPPAQGAGPPCSPPCCSGGCGSTARPPSRWLAGGGGRPDRPPSITVCGRMKGPMPIAMAPPAVHRLGHVALRVTDMPRAKAFYTALGLRLTWDAPDWAYLQSPTSGDGVALLSPDYTAAGPHFAFHFASRAAVDAVHAQLQASGHPVGPVHDHRDGTASFYLQDPEGNWLEVLYEPPAGIPTNTGDAPIPAQLPVDGSVG